MNPASRHPQTDSPLKLAMAYMDIFYRSGRFSDLYDLSDPALEFEGPLFSFSSAKAYIRSLVESPPVHCRYEILESFETTSSACLIHRFTKTGKLTVMAQIFHIYNKRIKK